jgi:glycosyltransferase involved in cell wall biosynthesis
MPTQNESSAVNGTPLVSIVMPVYNGEQYIQEALDSCLAQTYTNIEIIIVNDGSTDATANIVQQYDDAIRSIYQENQGPSVARNQAIKLAQGDYIKFCDADDHYSAAIGRLLVVQRARYYSGREKYLDDKAYDKLEAGRQHVFAFNRSQARQAFSETIRLDPDNAFLRRLYRLFTLALPPHSVDWLIKFIQLGRS